MLGNYDLVAELTALRRDLHRMPEISGEEEKTAARMSVWLRDCGADEVINRPRRPWRRRRVRQRRTRPDDPVSQ